MITGQNYEDEVQIEVNEQNTVDIVFAGNGFCATGEGAIKVGHALIAAGEEALKKAGKVSEH